MRHFLPPNDPWYLQYHRQVQRKGNERIPLRLQSFRYLASPKTPLTSGSAAAAHCLSQ